MRPTYADSALITGNSPSRETAMSESLERQLDLTLDMRDQRRRQHAAELAQTETSIHGTHRELERRRARFTTEVRSLLQTAVDRANRHLASRPEECRFSAVSGYHTGPLYVGGSACDPIVYELRIDGQEVGETLIVELTHDGMIEACLGPFRPSVCEAQTSRIDFRWHAVPLYQFDARHAAALLVQYLAAVTERWPPGGVSGGEATRNTRRNVFA